MAKRCDACGTIYMDSEAHSCAAEAASRRKAAGRVDWTEGSFGVGIVLGVLLGLLGILAGYLMKQHETYRGAIYGFVGRLAVTFVLLLFAFLASVVFE